MERRNVKGLEGNTIWKVEREPGRPLYLIFKGPRGKVLFTVNERDLFDAHGNLFNTDEVKDG